MSRKMCAMRKRTIVYVDGFNLYYGLLKKTKWRWLDLVMVLLGKRPATVLR